MKPTSIKYLLTWLSLIIAALSSVLLFYMSNSAETLSVARFILSLAAWILLAGSVIFLFIQAYKNLLNPEEDNEPSTPAEKEIKPSKTVKADKLDIQSVAKKISRKAGRTRKPEEMGKLLLDTCVKELEIMSGVFYYADSKNVFKPEASYANPNPEAPYTFKPGEGITGQAAKNKQVMVIRNIPEEYGEVFSGLGSSRPSYIAIMPIVKDDKTQAVLEVAGFRWHNDPLEQLFQIIARELGLILNEKDIGERKE